jgi:hypothetical protein
MQFDPVTRKLYILAGMRNRTMLSDMLVYDIDSDTLQFVLDSGKHTPSAGERALVARRVYGRHILQCPLSATHNALPLTLRNARFMCFALVDHTLSPYHCWFRVADANCQPRRRLDTAVPHAQCACHTPPPFPIGYNCSRPRTIRHPVRLTRRLAIQALYATHCGCITCDEMTGHVYL